MSYICNELERTFDTQEALFKALRDNASKLIDVKKSNTYKSIDKGGAIKLASLKTSETTKAELGLKEGYIYPVINTVNYLDSHNDLHIEGIWTKSVKEKQGTIHYVADHEVKTTSIIAWKSDVKMLVKDVEWSSVGKSYSGSTQALIFEIDKNKIRLDSAKRMIDDNLDVENSVRMRYMDVKLCYNSSDIADKEYKKAFDKYYPYIVNKDEFENINYFYAILQAAIVDEGSMVVNGSNSATRVIQTKDNEPSEDTHEEPPLGTHKKSHKGKIIFY